MGEDQQFEEEYLKEYKLPWMPLYVEDLLSSGFVQILDDSEFTAYFKLLLHQWRYGYIPNDQKVIAKLLSKHVKSCNRILKRVGEKFECQDNKLINLKLYQVRKKQIKNHINQIKKSKLAIQARQMEQPAGQPAGTPMGQPTGQSTGTPVGSPAGQPNLEPRNQNLEPRTKEFNSLLPKPNTQDMSPTSPHQGAGNRPLKKGVLLVSGKSQKIIHKIVNSHKEACSSIECSDSSKKVQSLYHELLTVPELNQDGERTLEFIIQARHTKNKKSDAAVMYTLLTSPGYSSSDWAKDRTKKLIQDWRQEETVPSEGGHIVNQLTKSLQVDEEIKKVSGGKYE